MEVNFNFPARVISIDQFGDELGRGGRAVCQQAPFDWFNAVGRADFAGNDVGGADTPALAIGNLDGACPQLLADRPRFLGAMCGHPDGDLAQCLTVSGVVPESLAVCVRKAAIVLGAHQPIGGRTSSLARRIIATISASRLAK